MENFFDEQISSLGQKFTDPMLAGITGAKVSDELRSLSAIKSSAESSELKFENINTGNDYELLLPQNELGVLGLSESKESLEKNPIEKNDPLIRKGSNVVEKVDPLTGETSNEVEIQRRSGRQRDWVNITSPTSRTNLEPGDRYTIRWTDNFSDNVRLYLYKGSSWKQTISSSTYSDGSYSWIVPTWLSSGSDYRIRIRNVNDSSVYDYSSSFTIEPDEQVNITSPTSRTNLEPGDRYTIRWTDNFSDNVRLELYKGSSWKQTISSSTSSDGSYSWRVPTWLSSGSDYKIRIRNVNDSSVSDYSSSFRIQPDKPDEVVNITSPTSSTSVSPGQSYNIRWTDNFSDNVRLELYKGSSWKQTISTSTSSDGSYYWTVPTWLSSGSDYKIRARNVNDSSVYDYSSSFTIKSQTTWPPRNFENWEAHGRKEKRAYVSVGNDDYYKFNIDSPGYLQFALRGLSADANLELRNSSGRVLTSSSNSGTRDEYGTYNLGTGTHYMRVYGNGGSTNYNLTLNLDQAKNDRSNARWLGDLTGQRKEYKDFIGTNSGDPYDYYKFSIKEPRFLEYALRDLTANADVDILDYRGYRISPKEEKDHSLYNQHETMGLKAGTYYAKVTAPTSSSQQTNYRLVLNLTGKYDPEKPDIDIKLDYPNSGFTWKQEELIEKAAQNWERIITRDKDDSGILRIAVTEGSTDLLGKSWEKGVWGQAYMDSNINYRYNDPRVDIGGNDYDNRIHFNSRYLDSLSNSQLVRLSMHEIGHTLGLNHEDWDSNSLMNWQKLAPNMTSNMYNNLDKMGYEFDRNATIYWS